MLGRRVGNHRLRWHQSCLPPGGASVPPDDSSEASGRRPPLSAELEGPQNFEAVGRFRVGVGVRSVVGQSWARDRHQRPRLAKRCINQRKLTRETDSKAPNSAELKGPRKLVRIRPESISSQMLGQKLGQTKPEKSGSAPVNRHTAIPNDSGPIGVFRRRSETFKL